MHNFGIYHGNLNPQTILCNFNDTCDIKVVTNATAFWPEHLREYRVSLGRLPYWVTPELI